MKTRKMYQVCENHRSLGRRLRSRSHALRAVRALRRLGRDAYVSAITINGDEFDGNGRRVGARS